MKTASGSDTSSRVHTELVRVATVGSVDDGKSTLLGRLLADAAQLPTDELEAVRRYSDARGDEYLDLSLVTDGLRAEREQGITIDVAYRHMRTPRRTFLVADCPGHERYTRNVVTGASLAQCAILLIDARQGLTQQGRRHALLMGLMRVPHLVVCVNKMDLVDFDQAVFDRIREEYTAFSARLNIHDVAFIPTSALHGDNVVHRSARMPWYEGPPLIYHLEHIHTASDPNLVDVRFPIQVVLRPRSSAHHDYRAYGGRVASGLLRPGDPVVILPSGVETTITEIATFDGPVGEAFAGMSVNIALADDVDAGRGDMIVRPQNRPMILHRLEATLCCLEDDRVSAGSEFVLRIGPRSVRAFVDDVRYRMDVNTLHRRTEDKELGLNDIGRVLLRTSAPIFGDPYHRNRTTGSFILADPHDHRTIAAGMIIGPAVPDDDSIVSAGR